MVDNIEINSPLGKSDHSVIEYTYNCYLDTNTNTETKLIYDRGNYEEMRKDMTRDWRRLLSGKNVEDSWLTILEALQSSVDRNIPKRKLNQDTYPLPMNSKNQSEIRKKHRMWSRYMETRDEDKKRDYNRQ